MVRQAARGIARQACSRAGACALITASWPWPGNATDHAYMFIDMGPSGYCEGFTLVHRSDLCEVFFPMVEKLRARFGGSQPLNLFRQLLVDCAGEHISEKFLAKCVEHNIERQLPSTRKENMGLAEITIVTGRAAGILFNHPHL